MSVLTRVSFLKPSGHRCHTINIVYPNEESEEKKIVINKQFLKHLN